MTGGDAAAATLPGTHLPEDLAGLGAQLTVRFAVVRAVGGGRRAGELPMVKRTGHADGPARSELDMQRAEFHYGAACFV